MFYYCCFVSFDSVHDFRFIFTLSACKPLNLLWIIPCHTFTLFVLKSSITNGSCWSISSTVTTCPMAWCMHAYMHFMLSIAFYCSIWIANLLVTWKLNHFKETWKICFFLNFRHHKSPKVPKIGILKSSKLKETNKRTNISTEYIERTTEFPWKCILPLNCSINTVQKKGDNSKPNHAIPCRVMLNDHSCSVTEIRSWFLFVTFCFCCCSLLRIFLKPTLKLKLTRHRKKRVFGKANKDRIQNERKKNTQK